MVEKLAVERSSSRAGRLHLADDVWVTERSEDKVIQEKQKARQELEEVKQARLETLEPERPSSRVGELARQEALRELEEIKKVRSELIEKTKEQSEVSIITFMLIYHNQYACPHYYRTGVNVNGMRKKGNIYSIIGVRSYSCDNSS